MSVLRRAGRHLPRARRWAVDAPEDEGVACCGPAVIAPVAASISLVVGPVGVGLAVLLGLPGLALAADPTITPGPEGDPRSPGQGPGFVGEPLLAIGAVLAIALLTVLVTLAYVRLTAGRARR